MRAETQRLQNTAGARGMQEVMEQHYAADVLVEQMPAKARDCMKLCCMLQPAKLVAAHGMMTRAATLDVSHEQVHNAAPKHSSTEGSSCMHTRGFLAD
jgi:hypothetical protein